MRKLFIGLAVLFAGLSVVSCDEKEDKVEVKPIAIQLEDLTSNELVAEQTLQLEATVLPMEADQTVTWESSDEALATVDENGLVTGVAKGEVIIKASAINGLKATVKLTITPAPWVIDPNMVGTLKCIKLQARYIKDGSIYEEDNMDELFVMPEGKTMEEWCQGIKESMNNRITSDATMIWPVALKGGKTKEIVGSITKNEEEENMLIVNYDVDNSGINFGDRQEEYKSIKLGWTVGGTEAVYDEVGGSFYDFIYTCEIVKDGSVQKISKTISRKELRSFKCAK